MYSTHTVYTFIHMYTEELLPFIFYTAWGVGVGGSMILNSAQLLYVHVYAHTYTL